MDRLIRARNDMNLYPSQQDADAETPDRVLVEAARHALPAFEHLYRRYVDDIYRFCFRRLGNEADVADATSQIFARALTNIGACDPDSFRAWLYAIARNVVTDTWRANRSGVDLDTANDVPDLARGPEEHVIASQESLFLREKVAELSPDQRAVIELRLAGLTAAEIAITLGKNRNAVDQLQFRAVNRLRTLLAVPVEVGSQHA
jgi:RNA polymerase sigma-70 factor (ECF subfamily)